MDCPFVPGGAIEFGYIGHEAVIASDARGMAVVQPHSVDHFLASAQFDEHLSLELIQFVVVHETSG